MFHDYMGPKRVAQFYEGDKNGFSGVKDLTNRLECRFELKEPDRTWGSWWKGIVKGRKNIEIKGVFEKCEVVLAVKDVDSGLVLANGWGNYCSLIVWDDMVYWRYSDDFDEWDYTKEGMNIGENSSANRPDIKM